MFKKIFFIGFVLMIVCHKETFAQTRKYYQEPTWKPRAILPYADAINNNFWPASPSVDFNYDDADFDERKLSAVPAPGIYPRVLITPTDVDIIKNKVALGDKAPAAFKVMWQRVSKLRTPFYALITNNDTLGRKLAAALVQKAKNLFTKIDALDKQEDRDNIWAAERSAIATGDPNPPSEIWDLLEYDYLHKWMTDSERKIIHQIIAKIVHKRISNFLMVPDHFMINNHEGFGMEYIRLMLLIEGQEGFDTKLFELCQQKAEAMLNWYLDKDGMCYESIKGWLNTSAMVAVGLRKRELLKHSHLRAKMNFFLAAIRWENNEWHIRDEMRASAFHVIWMMHYYHPDNNEINFLYASTFTTHDFLNDAKAKWPDPVGICYELLLLYAEDVIKDKNGIAIDWKNQTNINQLKLPLIWHDSARGYVNIRNSWQKEDLKVDFVCKQDFFYGGHEGSENNRITLWKDGVNWIQDNNMLATKATFLQNMLTIDGKGLHWPPVAGNWLGIQQSDNAVIATGDGKMGYSYTKVMQTHPLYYPSAQIPYYKAFTENNYDLTRDIQIAFQPATIQFNNGYAHTDYGPWSGETRLVEGYKPFNEVQRAFRTVQVAKGKYPYVLVVDDVQKDNQAHQYDFNLCMPIGAELIEVKTPEIVFQNTNPSAERTDELIIASHHINRDANGKPILQKGEPLCLIKVLNRNTDYGFLVPSLQQFEGYNLLNIPAKSIAPDFKILIYPFKYGEPLPTTVWNKERTELSVSFKEQNDVYNFSTTDASRTAIALQRKGDKTFNNYVQPKQPTLLVRGKAFTQSDYRYTRNENSIPNYLINDSVIVAFEYTQLPSEIHYTIDGSEPTMQSPVFTQPFSIQQSCVLTAKTFNKEWMFGEEVSKTLQASFTKQTAAKGKQQLEGNYQKGLSLQLFEINTKPYNDKGFFDADKIMMPDVHQYKADYRLLSHQFDIPYLSPTQPIEEQVKGFYQFKGWFFAKEKAVYTFTVNSCGPVTLDIANRAVIEVTSIFHQQQQKRKGEVVLDKGWHELELVVCDPQFWNANSLGNMPLTVTYQLNDGIEETITDNILATSENVTAMNDVKTLAAVKNLPQLEKGFDVLFYDRTNKRHDRDFMDIEQLKPFKKERTNIIEVANNRNSVRAYNGYYYAAVSGLYQFNMPYRRDDETFLGSTQASCQSMIKIDNEYILQRGVYGRNLSGKVYLEKGWHTFSLRLGTGVPECSVTLPDGQTVNINARNIFRTSLVNIQPDNINVSNDTYEFFDNTSVQLYFNRKDVQIRFTTDGSEPTIQSTLYKSPINTQQSTILKAAAFQNNQQLTQTGTLQLNKANKPHVFSLGTLRFNNWDEKSQYYTTNTGFSVWLNNNVSLTKSSYGKSLQISVDASSEHKNVDVNVSRGTSQSGFKIYHLNMRENALTVSAWFKTNDLNGRLFDKEGYNAYGKRYRTIDCTLQNGKIFGMGNRINAGNITMNEWQHLVFAASEDSISIYLNGVLVATAIGTKDITTDALDFFSNMNVVVDEVELFDAYLKELEVKQLFKAHTKIK
jgi:hypothetical protein